MWLMFACRSAVFAGITSILVKCGIQKTDSTVATAVRTIVVSVFSWIIVGITGGVHRLSSITCSSCLFLILSGVATGASWLSFYHALQIGPESGVVPVDKLSILVTALVSYFV